MLGFGAVVYKIGIGQAGVEETNPEFRGRNALQVLIDSRTGVIDSDEEEG